jgi:hypothetical protein
MAKHTIIEKTRRYRFIGKTGKHRLVGENAHGENAEQHEANQKQVPAKNKKFRSKNQSRFNAVTTGVYATGPLPWESGEEFKRHCDEFLNFYKPVGYIERSVVLDMALNRWRRQRTRLMTSVAINRHGFGRALMKSAAQTWEEVETFLRGSNVENKQTLEGMRESIAQLLETGTQLKQKCFDTDEILKFMQELADTCTNSYELLESIYSKLDLEREFFDRYMPKNLEETVRVENALDAQFDKLHSRLQVYQEARLRREALSLSKQANVLLGNTPDAAESDSPSDDGGTELDAPDGDETSQPPANGADDKEHDPLAKFVAEQSK